MISDIYSVCQKHLVLFFNISMKKWVVFDNFGYTTSGRNWSPENINVPTSSTKCCRTTLGSAKKVIFKLHSTIFLSNQLIF